MVEDELLNELSRIAVARLLTKLKEDGELENFVEFAKEKAKEDNMDSDDFMSFLDGLGEIAKEPIDDDGYNWQDIEDAIGTVLPNFKVYFFIGDKTIAIENELITDEEILTNYCNENVKAPLNIETLNGALEPKGYKLEFMESLNIPFKLDDISNFLRFKVIKLE